MLSDKLVKMIDDNAERLTARWIEDVKTNTSTPGYNKFSSAELHDKVYDVFKRLSHWMKGDISKNEIAMYYTRLGRTRYHEKFHLGEVIFATILAKRYLIQFIDEQGLYDDTLRMNTLLEFHDRINFFFDKVIFFMAIGFENAHVIEEMFYAQNGFFDKTVDAFTGWILKRG